MLDINSTLIAAIPVLEPFVSNIQVLVSTIQYLVGGLFGLYLILIYLRWKEARDMKMVLKEIRDEVKKMSEDLRFVYGEKRNK